MYRLSYYPSYWLRLSQVKNKDVSGFHLVKQSVSNRQALSQSINKTMYLPVVWHNDICREYTQV